MAQRRMMTKSITNSARFIKMPKDSQALYFHLCMNADDDGIVEAFSIMKQIDSGEDNLRVLAAKSFVKVLNEDLVTFIMDWNDHNKIRADRKINSIYKDLLISVLPEAQIIYPKPRTDVQDNSKRLGSGQSTDSPFKKEDKKKEVDSPRTAQVSIGKDRVGEVRKDNIMSAPADAEEIINNNFNTSTELNTQNTTINDATDESGEVAGGGETQTFSLSDKLSMMKKDKRRHIQIIALYWEFKDMSIDNEEQYASAMKRDMRAASALKGYPNEQIIATMKYLQENAKDYVWVLETVNKRINQKVVYQPSDENLSEREYHSKYLAYDSETGQTYKYGNATEDEVSPEELKAYKEKLANHEKYLKENKGKSPKPINFEEFKADFKKPTGKITKKDDLYLVPCPE